MDKLKLAFKLIAQKAKQKQDAGAVPAFLGVRGLLALMYDRIVCFSQSDEDQTDYVLDLAVNAMFAFASVLPDMESFDDDEPQQEEVIEDETKADEAQTPDEPAIDDPRWTPVAPGDPLPTRREVKEE